MAQDAGDRAFGRGKETRGGRRGARVRSRKRLCMGQGVAREGTLGASRRVTLWQKAFAGGASRVAFGRTPAGGEPTKQRLPLEWLDGPFAIKSELAKACYVVSERTVRRTLKGPGFRWKRPKYVLGRPDPDHESKKGE